MTAQAASTPEDWLCDRCGGSKPTCCSCPPSTETPVERIIRNYRDAHQQALDAHGSVREPRHVEDHRYAAARYFVGVSIGLRMAAGYLGVPDEALDG